MSHPTKLCGYLPLWPPAFVLSEIGNQCFVDLCTIMQIKGAGGHFTPLSDFTLGITHWLYPRPALAIGSTSRIPGDVAIWWGRPVLCVGGQHSRKNGERKRRGSAMRERIKRRSPGGKCCLMLYNYRYLHEQGMWLLLEKNLTSRFTLISPSSSRVDYFKKMSCYVGKQEMCVHENNLNRELYTVVEVSPVT